MSDFSEETLTLLRRAGWHENYRYDVSTYSRFFAQAGCPVPEIVLNFLTRFGGLHINDFSRFNRSMPVDLGATIDPSFQKIICIDNDVYCERIGIPRTVTLYIIGSSHERHIELLMTPEGAVYGVYDEFMLKVGDSGEDALEALCSGRELVEIP